MHAYGISEQEVGLSIGLQAGAIALVSLYGSYKVDVLQLRKLACTGPYWLWQDTVYPSPQTHSRCLHYVVS